MSGGSAAGLWRAERLHYRLAVFLGNGAALEVAAPLRGQETHTYAAPD
jgi:hypothetical protein